jgi:hypothetical protein
MPLASVRAGMAEEALIAELFGPTRTRPVARLAEADAAIFLVGTTKNLAGLARR